MCMYYFIRLTIHQVLVTTNNYMRKSFASFRHCCLRDMDFGQSALNFYALETAEYDSHFRKRRVPFVGLTLCKTIGTRGTHYKERKSMHPIDWTSICNTYRMRHSSVYRDWVLKTRVDYRNTNCSIEKNRFQRTGASMFCTRFKITNIDLVIPVMKMFQLNFCVALKPFLRKKRGK